MKAESTHAALRRPQTIGIASPAFQSGKSIPRVHTGFGDDVSPMLRLTAVPDAAQALALVMDDPDAPGGTFTHWTAWDLDADLRELPEGVRIPQLGGYEGHTDFGTSGYRGPKPPAGPPHRYFFRVFALEKRVGLPANSEVDAVWQALDKHTLAWGELMGTFQRP